MNQGHSMPASMEQSNQWNCIQNQRYIPVYYCALEY